MTTDLALGGTKITVGVARLLASWPHFAGALPYEVHSPVSVDVFRIFVAALEGTPPVLTQANMNELLSLCKEFGFTDLLSQVSAFMAMAEQEGKDVSHITEENLQIKEAFCPLQGALSRQARETAQLGQSLCLLREALAREITAVREAQAKYEGEIARLREG
jgi:hypothetical protein